MGLFKKKTPKVIRQGSSDEVIEVRTVNGQQVTVRRSAKPEKKATATKQRKPQQKKQQQSLFRRKLINLWWALLPG